MINRDELEAALKRLLAKRPAVWTVTEELQEWAEYASACEEEGERNVDYDDAIQLGRIAGGRDRHEWVAWWYEDWDDTDHPGHILAVTVSVVMSVGALDGVVAGAITTLPVQRADARGSGVSYEARSWGPRVAQSSKLPLP